MRRYAPTRWQIRSLARAWAAQTDAAADKVLLLALAAKVDGRGHMRLSIEAAARDAGLSTDTARGCLARLMAADHVTLIGAPGLPIVVHVHPRRPS